MTWDVTTPTGSEAASSGDDRIRELKTDLQTALQANDATLGNEGIFPVNPTTPAYRYRGLKGTTAQRPSFGNYGLYFNTTTGTIQRDSGAAWEDVGSLGTAQGISSNLVSQAITATSPTDLTGLSVTITCTGRPVFVGLMNSLTDPNRGGIRILSSASQSQVTGFIRFERDSVNISEQIIENAIASAGVTFGIHLPPSAFWMLDIPTAGSRVYKARGYVSGANMTLTVSNTKLVVYEI